MMDEIKRLRGECLFCKNEGRYITALEGVVLCSLHDMTNPHTSVKLSQIPRLLHLVDEILNRGDLVEAFIELRTMLQKKRPE